MKNKYILLSDNNGIHFHKKTWISLDKISQFVLNKQNYIEKICSGEYAYNYLYDINNKYICEIKDLEANTPL